MTSFNAKFLALAIAALSFLPSFGQETLVLKNGTELYGHTSKEDFAARTVTFMYDSAVIVANVDDIRFGMPVERDLSRMKKKWKDWFEANPDKIINRDGKQFGWLGDVSVQRGFFKGLDCDAIILERSDSTVTFFSLEKISVVLPKNKIVDHFDFEPRNPLALRGTVDEIELLDGTVLQGQIVAEYPSKVVLLTNDGVRNEIRYRNNIKAIRSLPFNLNMPLVDQKRFLDKITYIDENGDRRDAEGIIREKVYYSKKGEKPYYEMLDADCINAKKYYFDDVVAMSLSPNNLYKDDLDVILDDDELMINRKIAGPIIYNERSDRYEITDTTGIVTIKLDTSDRENLTIFYKDTPDNDEYIFFEVSPKYSFGNSDNRRNNNNNNSERVYFTAQLSDALYNNFPPFDRFVSPAGNVTVKYGPVSRGKTYMLLCKSNPEHHAYLVNVE